MGANYSSNKLPAEERIAILTQRIANVRAGAGDFMGPAYRAHAIADAEASLEEVRRDLATRAT